MEPSYSQKNDFQYGVRPPSWIWEFLNFSHISVERDVIVLCRTTEFNALDIVLNFDILRFHTFWYTSTIIFHHFSLNAYFCPNFHVFFWKNIKFKCCDPQKAHLCVRPRVLNSTSLTYFYICDLCTRRKKLFDCLSECVLVRKKNWNFPICLAKMG